MSRARRRGWRSVSFSGIGDVGEGIGCMVESSSSSATTFWHRALTSSRVRSRVGRLARARAREARELVRAVRR